MTDPAAAGLPTDAESEWTPAMDQACADHRQAMRDHDRTIHLHPADLLRGLASHMADGCPTDGRRGSSGFCRCGEPTPCPNHPTDVTLNGVERQVVARSEAQAAIQGILKACLQLRMAEAAYIGAAGYARRLLGGVEAHMAPERCCGGFGVSQQAECVASAVKSVRYRGIDYPVCQRCWERCRKAERAREQVESHREVVSRAQR